MAYPDAAPQPPAYGSGARRYSWRYSTVFGFYIERREHNGPWLVHDPTGTPIAQSPVWRNAMYWALDQRPAGWTPKGPQRDQVKEAVL